MIEAEGYMEARSFRQIMGNPISRLGQRIDSLGQRISGPINPEGLPPKPGKYTPENSEKPKGSVFEQAAFVIERDFVVTETLGLDISHRELLRNRLASHLAGVLQYVETYGGETGTQYILLKSTRKNWYEQHFKPHRSSDISNQSQYMIEGEINSAAESVMKILFLGNDFHNGYKEAVINFLNSNNPNIKSISKTLNAQRVEELRKKISEEPRIARHRSRLTQLGIKL